MRSERRCVRANDRKGLEHPETSSVGRIFDAASALLGVCAHPCYEGEAAILLEAAAHKAQAEAAGLPVEDERYRIGFIKNTATENSTAADTSVLLMDVAPVFAAMLDDMQASVPTSVIAARFHGCVRGSHRECCRIGACHLWH